MKKRVDYYPYYEKLMGMRLEELIEETPEYKILSERYPHLAESIKLKKEMERLKENKNSLQERTARLKIEREIIRTKGKLKRENVHKHLHRENKQEVIFNLKILKNKTSSSAREIYTISQKAYSDLQKDFHKSRKNLSKVLHKKLPPTIFNVKSLNVAEKFLSVKEWIQERF